MDITVQTKAPIVSTVMGIVRDAADIVCKNMRITYMLLCRVYKKSV